MKYFISIICLYVLSGCSAQKDVLIIQNDYPKSPPLPAEQPASSNTTQQQTQEEHSTQDALLEIEDALVSWGHRSAQRTRTDIDTVIIHSVYNPFDDQPHRLDDILQIFENYNVAPHYIITRDGVIHRTVREQDIAYHAGRSRLPDGRTHVNDNAIGIEMINSLDDVYTDAQYRSLRALLGDLTARYAMTYILGHDEIRVDDPWNFDWTQIGDLRKNPRKDVSDAGNHK